MQIEEYLLNYQFFYDEFFPHITSNQKFNKLSEAVGEYLDAVNEGIRESIIEETIDVMNTAIAYLYSEGVVNPLFAGYLKLRSTATKYRNVKARPDEI